MSIFLEDTTLRNSYYRNKNFDTLKNLIEEAMQEHGENFSDIVSCTLTKEEMELEFENDFGGETSTPFTLWTKNRVYFPTDYDGAQGVKSVSRNPDGKPTQHI